MCSAAGGGGGGGGGLHRDYAVGGEIGRGRFGVVRRCFSSATGEPFAVKTVDKSLLSDDFDRDLADREPKIGLLASAGNPHAVQIRAVYEDSESINIVMDLCPGPDLLSHIARRRLTEPESAALAADIAAAIAACHRRGVAHRDVKPDNLLFDAEGRLRLADFGSAEVFGDESGAGAMRGLVGTAYYAAPEVVAGREYGEKVDVWSAGVVIYMMLSGGAPPFDGETAGEVFEAVLRGNLRFPPRLFGEVSPAAKDLVRRMVCKDVSRRLSAEQVLRHPWIMSGGMSSVSEAS